MQPWICAALCFYILFLSALIENATAEDARRPRDHAKTSIVLARSPSTAEAFAGSELARYLQLMMGESLSTTTKISGTGVQLIVGTRAVEAALPGILPQGLGSDGFILRKMGNRILIAGASDRGTLYAVYALLERLGCRWFAPNFSYYGPAKGEVVPHISKLTFGDLNVVERPAFQWRKLYIEEGISHTAENLVQMVDWMAKARMNVLDCPTDYQHQGHTKWDNWRIVLTPELKKRGIIIEVGGHGYQTYIPEQTYFDKHPEWFGVRNGERSRNSHVVFASSNADAVKTLTTNVRDYLRVHPEIDIFDLWPPDGAQWSEASEDVALGSPTERQMLLLNQVANELKPEFPRLRIQFIAYQTYVTAPSIHKPTKGILMEFCPIDRSFESALYEGADPQNEEYFHALQGWLHGVIDPSSVSIYSYITKYSWRSLPILIPHLIVDEIRRYESMGLGGLATYSEPGSWAAFELDHYITARALWNPDMDVSREVASYADVRYGAAGKSVGKYLKLVEEVIPHAVGIPGTHLNQAKQKLMLERFAPAERLLTEARAAAKTDPAALILIAKLEHQYRYVKNEMELEQVMLHSSGTWHTDQYRVLATLINEREQIIQKYPEDGIIVQHSRYQ